MAVHFIGGVNGVGKSSIVDRVVQNNPNIARVHTTSHFMEWLGIQIGDYDSLRELSDTFKTEQNQLMLESIVRKTNEAGGVAVLDSHFLTLTEGEVSPPLLHGPWIANLGSMALITASAHTTISRMQQSPRDRKLFASADTHAQQVAQLEVYQQQTLEAFTALVGQYALPHLIVENDTTIEDAATAYLTFITETEGTLR